MPLDTEQSGEYLCQAGETVSCGACCGLYNVVDASPAALSRILAHRSELFDRVAGGMDAILEFERHIRGVESREYPLLDFHHCPYIGLVGEGYVRVGCLLHPLNPKNKGMDYRGLSYYGGMTCRVYFCPSAKGLDANISKIVKSTVQDWYTYGLVITENRLLAALFDQLKTRIGIPMDAASVSAGPQLAQSFRRLFQLKVNWPFKDKHHEYIGNYFFNDGLCPRPPINYGATGTTCSPYDAIFQELVSVFSTRKELKAAEKMLDGRIEDIARIYRQCI
jgi:hypothetical protein